jgi:hypothetical protein
MNYPFKRVITDIKNYFYIKKVIKQNLKTVEWEKYKLRADWIGRIYTIINLPPEVLYSPDAPQEIRPAYILEESKPINEYLTKLNLQEIVFPEIRPVDESISYLVVYSPYFQRISWKWILWRLFFIILLTWAQVKFEVISYLINKVYELFQFIF